MPEVALRLAPELLDESQLSDQEVAASDTRAQLKHVTIADLLGCSDEVREAYYESMPSAD